MTGLLLTYSNHLFVKNVNSIFSAINDKHGITHIALIHHRLSLVKDTVFKLINESSDKLSAHFSEKGHTELEIGYEVISILWISKFGSTN